MMELHFYCAMKSKGARSRKHSSPQSKISLTHKPVFWDNHKGIEALVENKDTEKWITTRTAEEIDPRIGGFQLLQSGKLPLKVQRILENDYRK